MIEPLNEQFDEYENRAPDLTQIMMQRLSVNKQPSSPNGFDPHQSMINKKKVDDGIPIDTSNTVKWPEQDVKALEDFCLKYGVVGFNCGRMSPIAALAMLKSKMGVMDGPLDKRVPLGYESILKTEGKTLLRG